MKHNYFIIDLDGKRTLFRTIRAPYSNIAESFQSLEVLEEGNWTKTQKLIKPFMNRDVTGWINEEDILTLEIANELLLSKTTKKIIEARNFALEHHQGQMYGDFPYSVHLSNVVSVMMRFGMTPEEDENLLTSAWLHDVLEDTDAKEEVLKTKFGIFVFDLVKSVTDDLLPELSKLEIKRQTFTKLVEDEDAIILKLADRIANVEFSIIMGNLSKIEKYVNEQILIRDILKPHIKSAVGNNMFNYLESLLVNP